MQNQPPPPPPGQSPYGQVPYGQVPYGQTPKKKRRWPWIVALIGGGLILACVALIAVFVFIINNSPAKAVAQHYCDALKSQDYPTAFSYVDPTIPITIQGQQQQISQGIFTQVAQSVDSAKGKVTACDITNVSLNSSTSAGNTADVTLNVTRNANAYPINLQLKQEGNDWKIVSLDNF